MRAIETSRLVMRNFIQEDWIPLQKMMEKFLASPYGIYDYQWPLDEQSLQNICRHFSKKNSHMAVCLREEKTFIGFIHMSPTGAWKTYEMGYQFDDAYHRKGYGYEACSAYLEYAFQHMGAEKVKAGTAAKNVPSCRLLEKLGMQVSGSEVASFCRDECGIPIEFLGYKYELCRIDWLAGEGQR